MSPEKLAEELKASVSAMLDTMERTGAAQDAKTAATVLGTVLGCFAAASDNPAETIQQAVAAAQGVTNGELLIPQGETGR
jgi:polygalacturonase